MIRPPPPATAIGAPREDVDGSTTTDVILAQYRVAWHEQIVMRMMHVAHDVRNSGYAAIESTGGLPYLLDLSSSSFSFASRTSNDDGGDDGGGGPVLVGWDHPGGLGDILRRASSMSSSSSLRRRGGGHSRVSSSGSHVVDYLCSRHGRSASSSVAPSCESVVAHPSGGEEYDQDDIVHDDHPDSLAYESLIRDRLDCLLLALRYGDDASWEGVYGPQCTRASVDPNNNGDDREACRAANDRCNGGGNASRWSRGWAFVISPWAWYQKYAERSLALRGLLPGGYSSSYPSCGRGGLAMELFRHNECDVGRVAAIGDDNRQRRRPNPFSSYGGGDSGRVNVRRAMELADSYYASLERRLLASSDGHLSTFLPSTPLSDGGGDCHVGRGGQQQQQHLLGTDKPTHVDALLFAHLAEALCNVHLVLVLSGHPVLLRYFGDMYDRYFGKGYADEWNMHNRGDGDDDWIRRNNLANANNAFNGIPDFAAVQTIRRRSGSSLGSTADVGGGGGGVGDDDDCVTARHDVVHAIQLMRRMAVHCCNDDDDGLETSLLDALDA